MARIPGCDDKLLEEHGDLLATIESNFGFVPDSFRTLAYKPALLRAVGALSAVVMSDDAITSKRLRWMVAYVASTAAGCSYCSAHTAFNLSKVCDVDVDTIDHLWTFEQNSHFSPAERAALRVALAAGSHPGSVDDAHIRVLNEHFSPEEVVELVAAISLFGFLNRWNATLGTSLEQAPRQFVSQLSLAPALPGPSTSSGPLAPVQGAVGGGLVFVSGQLALDANDRIVSDSDPLAQARRCFENVRSVLAEHQATFDDVVRINCYLLDATHYPAYATAKGEYLDNRRVASTTVVVRELLIPEALVEIEVIAVSPLTDQETEDGR